MRSAEIDALQSVLGYRFADPKLLAHALTHASAVSGAMSGIENYQRLEFLGDRVLGLSIAEMLYAAFPQADEGELHHRHRELVRRETCAEVARLLDLGKYLRLGESEIAGGGRSKGAILADAMEAVIAAVYLDGGFATARDLVERLWRPHMSESALPPRGAKNALQEWAQARGLGMPVYREVGRTGPDHDPTFLVEAEVPGLECARASGRTKREAEQNAAAALLRREKIWTDADG